MSRAYLLLEYHSQREAVWEKTPLRKKLRFENDEKGDRTKNADFIRSTLPSPLSHDTHHPPPQPAAIAPVNTIATALSLYDAMPPSPLAPPILFALPSQRDVSGHDGRVALEEEGDKGGTHSTGDARHRRAVVPSCPFDGAAAVAH